MATLIIGGASYDSYATIATANEYLAADVVHGATGKPATWADISSDDEKARLLVSSTRTIRGMAFSDGVDSEPDGSPPGAFETACILLAAAGKLNPGVFVQRDTGDPVLEETVGTGPVKSSQKFGRVKAALPLPHVVHRLLNPYLAIGGNACAPKINGGSSQASVSDGFGYSGFVG